MREITYSILFGFTTTTNVEFSSIVQPCLVGLKFRKNCFYQEQDRCGGPNLNFSVFVESVFVVVVRGTY